MVVGVVFVVQGLRNQTVRLRSVRVQVKTHKALCKLDLHAESGEEAGERFLRQSRGETEEKLDRAVRLAVVYSGYRPISEAPGLISQILLSGAPPGR